MRKGMSSRARVSDTFLMPYVSDDNKTNHVNIMCLAFQSNRKCCHKVRSLVEGVGAEKFVSPEFESFIPKNTYVSR